MRSKMLFKNIHLWLFHTSFNMPTGIDFICSNNICPGYQKKISVHGPFPLANIADVLNIPSISSDELASSGLFSKMKDGVKYALLPLPSEIKPVGIRLQYYLPAMKMILDRDLIWGQDDKIINSILNEEDDSDLFTKQIGTLAKSSRRLFADGCSCPMCFEKMDKFTWFTNVGVENWGGDGSQSSQRQ